LPRVKSAQWLTTADSRILSKFPLGFIVPCFRRVAGSGPRSTLAGVGALRIVDVRLRQRGNIRPGKSRSQPPQCTDPSVQSNEGSCVPVWRVIEEQLNLWPILRCLGTSGVLPRCPDCSYVANGENVRTWLHRAHRGNAGQQFQ
jgi:hypothetical protein